MLAIDEHVHGGQFDQKVQLGEGGRGMDPEAFGISLHIFYYNVSCVYLNIFWVLHT